ncbi:hypothetical protein JCM9279_003880 [Rhodotorula babjevae]
MTPRARLVFQVAPPLPAGPPLSPSSGARAPLPRSLPLPPAELAGEGTFSILPAGGVRVGEREVRVSAGSAVERVVERAVGLGESAKGLSWVGVDERGRSGQWTLWLLCATEGDVLAVQRVLTRLPPDTALPRPHVHARQAPPPPHLRNSILVYDGSTRSVLAVLPFPSSNTHTPPTIPPRPPKPHSHAHLAPSPAHHPSAADFAAYVNHVTAAIHPSPTPETLQRDERAARRRIERLAAEETADDELRLPPAPDMLELVALPDLEALGRTRPSTRSRAEGEGEGEPRWRDERDELEKGLERLDLETELARLALPGPSSVAQSPSHSFRQASSWTVSSWATRGTERFVTADEGDEDDRLEGESASRFTAMADSDITPRSSRLDEHHPVQQPPKQPLGALVDLPFPTDFSPTLTDGNAVLFSFLGGPSLVLPMSSSSSPASASQPHRIAVTAHPLSAEQASEMEAQGDIEPVVVQASEGSGVDVEHESSWWGWLVDLVGVGRHEDRARGEASWLGWLALPAFLSSSAPPTSRAETAASRLRRVPRSAGGEASGRLSVFHFDEAGTARRAFAACR